MKPLHSFLRRTRVPFTLMTLVLVLSGCTARSQMQIFAVALRVAIQEFQSQRNDVQAAFSAAKEAKRDALAQPEMVFTDKRTTEFIERWKKAEKEVRRLRAQFNEVIEKADFLFAYCQEKLSTIHGDSMRKQGAQAIQEKKRVVSRESVKTAYVIDQLESAIQKGNDVIVMLEIVGALQSLGSEISMMNQMHDLALEKIPEVDGLIQEGLELLDVELKALDGGVGGEQ